jgi:arsenate reductase
MIQILHNARCGKSRDCLAFLTESRKEFEVIKYLETVPTFEELKEIISKLGIKPIDLVRKKEPIWLENFKNKTLSDTEIIEAMIANPILIERPIVINGEKAVIARPLENAKSIL